MSFPKHGFETQWQNEPVCPHCSHIRRDAWEIDFGSFPEGETTITCGNCDNEYVVSRHVEITYCTSPKEKSDST